MVKQSGTKKRDVLNGEKDDYINAKGDEAIDGKQEMTYF